MFVIVYNERVILGPMVWNARRFSEVIDEECGVSVVLDLRNDDTHFVEVNSNIKIYPVTSESHPEYNTRLQFLNGPYWTFTDTQAIARMIPEYYSIDAIQNFLREEIANIRWKKQHAGVDVEINGTTYKFPTDPLARISFHHYLTSGINKVNWKINQEIWLELTSEHISTIFNKIVEHFQSSFEWESAKNSEITSATMSTINAIIVEE